MDASSRRPRRPYPLWAAAIAAFVVAALVVATLLGVRGVHRTQPAGQNVAPVPRSSAAIAYDEDRSVLVMFGGTANGTTPLGDTWTWDGTRWTQRHPAVSPPPERVRTADHAGTGAQAAVVPRPAHGA